jgi:hypothetical protein
MFFCAAPVHAAVVHVSTSGGDAAGCGSQSAPCKTLSHAVSVAASGDEVRLGAGTFPVPDTITVTKSLTLRGSGSADTVLDGLESSYSGTGMLRFATADTHATVQGLRIVRAGHGSNGRVYGILVKGGSSSAPGPGIDATVRDVAFIGSGTAPTYAVWLYQNAGSAVVEGLTTTGVTGNSVLLERQIGPVTVTDSQLEAAAGSTDAQIYDFSYGGATWDVRHSHTFSGNSLRGLGGLGVSAGTAGQASSDFTGTIAIRSNTIATAAGGSYGVRLSTVGDPAASANRSARAAQSAPGGEIRALAITDNTLSGPGAGDGVSLIGAIPGADVRGNVIDGYAGGIRLAPSPYQPAPAPDNADISANQLTATVGLSVTGATGVTAADNWWGCNAGPSAPGCQTIVSDTPGAVSVPSWIVLRVEVTPTVLAADGSAIVNVAMDHNNLGKPVADSFAGPEPVTLTATGGTLANASPPLDNLAATTNFSSTGATGRSVSATKDGQSVAVGWPDVDPSSSQSDLATEDGQSVGRDLLPACARAVAIARIEHGARVVIDGLARTQFSGQRVFITYEPTGARVLAAPRVHSDGSYHARIPLPAGPLAASNRARFTAHIGGADSKAIKRTRRLVASAVGYGDGKIRVAGLVNGPLPGARVQVTEGDSCGRYHPVGSVSVSPSGAFRGAVAFHSDRDAVAVRLRVPVRGEEGGSFTTYSIATRVEPKRGG